MTAEGRRFGLDTNILVYAVETGGREKARTAEMIVRRAVATRRCLLSLQNIGEFYHVCARKRHAPPEAAARRAADYGQLFAVVAPSMDEVRVALVEAAAGRFSYWDALLLATLSRAGCTTMLSEDMGDGATLGGVTVRNPFGGERMPADLERILS
jgi:predicted nucleic acid-binding protein